MFNTTTSKNFCLNCVPPSKLQPIEIDYPKNKTSSQFIVNSQKFRLVLLTLV
jgi:hypothetical protein